MKEGGGGEKRLLGGGCQGHLQPACLHGARAEREGDEGTAEGSACSRLGLLLLLRLSLLPLLLVLSRAFFFWSLRLLLFFRLLGEREGEEEEEEEEGLRLATTKRGSTQVNKKATQRITHKG